MKATAKTTSKVAAKVVAEVKASAKVLAVIKTLASVTSKAVALVTQQEKTTLNLGDSIASEHPYPKNATDEQMTEYRSAVRNTYAPAIVRAFVDAGKPEEYANQQLSRIIGFAYPGGRKGTAKQRETAKAQLALGRKLNLGVLDLASLASGNAKVKDGKIVKIASSSGGANAKTPIQNLEAAILLALNAAELAKLDWEQVRNTFLNVAGKCDSFKKGSRADSEKLS